MYELMQCACGAYQGDPCECDGNEQISCATEPTPEPAHLPWQYRATAALVAVWSLGMIYAHDWRAGIVATVVVVGTVVAGQ